jgi:hypothetical protein
MTDINDKDLLRIIEIKGLDFDLNRIFSNYNFSNEVFDEFNENNIEIIKKKDGIILPDDPDEKQLELTQCNKRFLDLMTNLVAKEVCFSDTNQSFVAKFQFLVNKIFEDNIKNYINLKRMKGAKLSDVDILFLYKGGTTMKIIYQKYKELLKGELLDEFFEKFSGSFDRSDSDYSLYINPHINQKDNGITFEKIYYEINIICYNSLDTLRNFFNEFPNVFVPLNLITDNVLVEKINEMNTVLADIKKNSPKCTNVHNIKEFIGVSFLGRNVFTRQIGQTLSDDNIDLSFASTKDLLRTDKYRQFISNGYIPTKKNDFLMTLVTKEKKRYYRNFPGSEKNDIYLSINESNEYENNNVFAYFSLQRLKINFVAYYISMDNKIGFFDCPSELIDVSILKKKASGGELFYSHIDREFLTYTYKSKDISFDFKSYSIFGHINDLVFILFKVVSYPWQDNKYLKRIRRLMFFVLLELFIYVKDQYYLNTILSTFESLTENPNTSIGVENVKNLRLLTQSIPNVHLASNTFFENLGNVVLKKIKVPGFDQKKYNETFAEMNSIMKSFMDKFRNKISSHFSMEKKGIVAELPLPETLREDSTVTFLGGFYSSKYLKYKTKNEKGNN